MNLKHLILVLSVPKIELQVYNGYFWKYEGENAPSRILRKQSTFFGAKMSGAKPSLNGVL
jgi:hypothetical protein